MILELHQLQNSQFRKDLSVSKCTVKGNTLDEGGMKLFNCSNEAFSVQIDFIATGRVQ